MVLTVHKSKKYFYRKSTASPLVGGWLCLQASSGLNFPWTSLGNLLVFFSRKHFLATCTPLIVTYYRITKVFHSTVSYDRPIATCRYGYRSRTTAFTCLSFLNEIIFAK